MMVEGESIMKTIQQRYAELKSEQELTDGIDKLIVDCYYYKIFKEKVSDKYKKEFKDDFERDYPVYVSDITKKLDSRLRGRISFYKEEEAYKAKAGQQRAKRGYADTDVWNMNTWFMDTISPMLKQFRKKHNGIPSSFLPSMVCTDEEREAANEKWEQILDRLIFLINEMDEDKCSMKNPYSRAYHSLQTRFRRELGWFGEKAKTDEEKKLEKEKGSSKMYFPTDFPDRYPTAQEINDMYFEYERKIFDYRNQCKNEFFELFSKHFWELWD
jgi:hypothetical protein